MNCVDYLKSKKSVAVFIHIDPDWDALGSASALQCVLRDCGVKCDIYTDEPLPFALTLMPTDTRVFDSAMPFDYECLCAVDVGAIDRIGRRAEAFAAHSDTVCIDHHVQSGDFAKIMHVQPSAAATAEILYELFGADISKKCAEYLFAGISADTGSFKYSNTTQHTFEIAASLASCGINIGAICEALFESKTEAQLRLSAQTIERTTFYANGAVAVSVLPDSVLALYGATKDDTDALSSVARSIHSVKANAFITQRGEGMVKVSLRSKGDVDIQRVAARLGGGGHIHAAGATFKATLEEAQTILAQLLEEALTK